MKSWTFLVSDLACHGLQLLNHIIKEPWANKTSWIYSHYKNLPYIMFLPTLQLWLSENTENVFQITNKKAKQAINLVSVILDLFIINNTTGRALASHCLWTGTMASGSINSIVDTPFVLIECIKEAARSCSASQKALACQDPSCGG